MKTNTNEIYQAYVEELTIYTRWLNKTKPRYGNMDIMAWDERDYRTINSWNDAFKLAERVLGLTEKEIEEACAESLIRAKEPGKDTPWNYWKETEIV